jgi:hypothetical protein
MEWIRDIALFLVFSGILLELISDTKYYKFAKWVAGMILLLQFIKPLADTENFGNWLSARIFSFDYAMGTDRIIEEIYAADDLTENSVLSAYKANVSAQIDRLLGENGLQLAGAEIEVQKDGKLQRLQVLAVYKDKQEKQDILVPTVAPVRLREMPENLTVSPMELYIRELLAGFYGMDENLVEVIIQEA